MQSISFSTVVHSFTHVRMYDQMSRIKKVPLPDSGIHRTSAARLQHDRCPLVTFKLPEGRTSRKNPYCLLGVSLRVIFAQAQVHPFPDKIQTQHSQTELHKEESSFFVKRMLVTAGVSDDVAQDLQMLIGPQKLDDVEEPMPARPATLKDPGTPDQIVLDQHSPTPFPSQPWCKQDVRRISRTRFTTSRKVEHRRNSTPISV